MNFDNTPTEADFRAKARTWTNANAPHELHAGLANLGFGQSDSGGSAIEQVISNAEEGAYANLGGAL